MDAFLSLTSRNERFIRFASSAHRADVRARAGQTPNRLVGDGVRVTFVLVKEIVAGDHPQARAREYLSECVESLVVLGSAVASGARGLSRRWSARVITPCGVVTRGLVFPDRRRPSCSSTMTPVRRLRHPLWWSGRHCRGDHREPPRVGAPRRGGGGGRPGVGCWTPRSMEHEACIGEPEHVAKSERRGLCQTNAAAVRPRRRGVSTLMRRCRGVYFRVAAR